MDSRLVDVARALVFGATVLSAQGCAEGMDLDEPFVGQAAHQEDPPQGKRVHVEPLPPTRCLDGITEFDKPGPFTFTPRAAGPLNIVKMWVPDVPAGCKVPVIHLANGTGGWCGVYEPSLARLASHGFLAVCFDSPITGGGHEGMTAFETALSELPELADKRFGSTGHSQGGMGALITLEYAERKWGSSAVYAGLAMQPASGFGEQPLIFDDWVRIYRRIQSPVFMFSGWGTDGLVPEPWVALTYAALSPTVEAYFWAKLSAHIPVPNEGEMQIAIPWFRWKLLGDREACEYFKTIPSKDVTWQVRAAKNEQACP